MSWNTDDGEHELFILPAFADGKAGASHSIKGVDVSEPGEDEDWRDPAGITGWLVGCDCRPGGAWNPTRTVLAHWTRVRGPEDEDPAAGRFYANDDSDAEFLSDRDDAERAAFALWDVHRKPATALRVIEEAAQAQREAARQLDAAVTAGRAAALSWADIGRAVGITRQSARERWGTTSTAAAAAGDLTDRIRAAYTTVAGMPGNWASLTGIRRTLADVPRGELDAALQQLALQPGVTFNPDPQPGTLTDEDRHATLHLNGYGQHMLMIED